MNSTGIMILAPYNEMITAIQNFNVLFCLIYVKHVSVYDILRISICIGLVGKVNRMHCSLLEMILKNRVSKAQSANIWAIE